MATINSKILYLNGLGSGYYKLNLTENGNKTNVKPESKVQKQNYCTRIKNYKIHEQTMIKISIKNINQKAIK